MSDTPKQPARGRFIGKCREHGAGHPSAWACPACLVDLRQENARLKDTIAQWQRFAHDMSEPLRCLPSVFPSENGHMLRVLRAVIEELREAKRPAGGP